MITKFSEDWKLISFITNDVGYIENLIRDNLSPFEKATNINISFDVDKIVVTFVVEEI